MNRRIKMKQLKQENKRLKELSKPMKNQMLLIDILDHMPRNQEVCVHEQNDYSALSTSASIAMRVLPERMLISEVECFGSGKNSDTIAILLKNSFTDKE